MSRRPPWAHQGVQLLLAVTRLRADGHRGWQPPPRPSGWAPPHGHCHADTVAGLGLRDLCVLSTGGLAPGALGPRLRLKPLLFASPRSGRLQLRPVLRGAAAGGTPRPGPGSSTDGSRRPRGHPVGRRPEPVLQRPGHGPVLQGGPRPGSRGAAWGWRRGDRTTVGGLGVLASSRHRREGREWTAAEPCVQPSRRGRVCTSETPSTLLRSRGSPAQGFKSVSDFKPRAGWPPEPPTPAPRPRSPPSLQPRAGGRHPAVSPGTLPAAGPRCPRSGGPGALPGCPGAVPGVRGRGREQRWPAPSGRVP